MKSARAHAALRWDVETIVCGDSFSFALKPRLWYIVKGNVKLKNGMIGDNPDKIGDCPRRIGYDDADQD